MYETCNFIRNNPNVYDYYRNYLYYRLNSLKKPWLSFNIKNVLSYGI